MTEPRYPSDLYHNNEYIKGHVDGQILALKNDARLLADIGFADLDKWFRISMIREAHKDFKTMVNKL